MIRRWLDALVRHLTDDDWLHDRRVQEISALRAVPHTSRPPRHKEPPFERDFFPHAQTRPQGGQK